ncbi:MAG TPA: hypothetical protein VMK42_11485 [Anaeromyxobacteraceae bacterium]|nr:hypothetical protein [Anaeromyxobacteraceae bacterium]
MHDPRREAARLYRELGPVAYRCSLGLLGSAEEASAATRDVLAALVSDLAALEGPGGIALVHRRAAGHCQRLLGHRGDRSRERGRNAPGCPSELELEEVLVRRRPEPPHLEACPGCRERLLAMERQGEEFRGAVYPATVDSVMEAALAPWSRGWRRRFLVVFPLAGLATSVSLLLLLAPRLASDEMGPKIAPLGLAVRGEDGRALHDGARVATGQELHFRVRTAVPCHLWLAAAAEGGVSRLYPPGAEAGLFDGAGELPAQARLDGSAGPVRLYAVCTPAPSRWDEVESAVRGASGGSEKSVRLGGALAGMPKGTLQATVLFEKRP